MSLITVRTTVKGIDATMARVSDKVGPLKVAGRAVRNLAVFWFRKKNADEPNKLGGKRTNFWTDVGRSVLQPMPKGADKIQIDVTHPSFAQKYLGGTIVPKRVKWLTIPASPLAYGKPAASFKLAFVFLSPTLAMLVMKSAMEKEKSWKTQRNVRGEVHTFTMRVQHSAGDVMYWLKKRVVQKPWPGCFPPQVQMEEEARKAYEADLARRMKGSIT